MSFPAQQHILPQVDADISKTSDPIETFERDIEDAIFEEIEASPVGSYTDKRSNDKRAAPTVSHIAQMREQLVSNQNSPEQKLSVFSKSHGSGSKKPYASQLFLTLAICSIGAAILYPSLMFFVQTFGTPNMPPDEAIFTGSVSNTQPLTAFEKNEVDPLESVILGEPKQVKTVNEGHTVRIDRGSNAGSIIYIRPN